MKLQHALGLLGMAAAVATADLETGDIAFTGFSGDGIDGIAFVTFKDIPANTVIYFCDDEWNGSGFGLSEGAFGWNSGVAVVPAGTVVSISDPNGTITASQGTVIEHEAGGFGNSDEAVFAFLGTNNRTPTTMLAAIGTRATSFYQSPATDLSGTDLVIGSSAILLTTDVDIAEYNGPRSGMTQEEYIEELNDMANWLTQDASGDQSIDMVAPDMPFSLTTFSLSPPVSVSRPVGETANPSAFSVRHLPGREVVMFSKLSDYELTDVFGRVLRSGKSAGSVELKGLARGRYFLSVPGEKSIGIPVTR